ncbi:MAG: DUF4926 domain-containing protein [Coleofasciculaceae cyanobacterium SM2_1_6]|nr:DUF4926 domain-containing protein [Coleofasciculaceae cyanobacterium SM2_1_6]
MVDGSDGAFACRNAPYKIGDRTIVEIYNNEEESQYLVEFADHQGCEYAMAILKESEVLAIHYELTVA